MSEDLVAVVGVACRVPGAADPAALWEAVLAGTDAVRRYDAAELPERLRSAPDWVPAYGHLDDLAGFDAGLFGVRPEEAALLDPQHRLFLEVAWSALEDAGHAGGREQVGVFADTGTNRYLHHHLLGNPAVLAGDGLEPEDWDDALAGSGPDALPARVAYRLGLTGPAVAVQSACSSSLVAVALAAQSLLDLRCDVAIAGGAAVPSTRQLGYRHRVGGTSSPDGRCRPFDAAANGQVFGSGAGAVVLKRLDDALAAGDPVHAVLAGWAVTNDGAARAGFAAPGADGQAAVVVEALAAGGLEPADLGLVEAHAAGTPLGDALEVAALVRAFAAGGARPAAPVALGSVKGNLGNLDAAAGVVGLIKAVLAVREGVLPPTLLDKGPHPDLDLAGGPFVLQREAAAWTGPRRAGVSSFGQGGTNAHVVVEAPPPRAAAPAEPGWRLLPLSAASPAALAALAGRLSVHLRRSPVDLADVAHTLATGRRPLPVRAAVVARDTDEAADRLERTAAAGLDSPAGPGGSDAAGLPSPTASGGSDVPGELRARAEAWVAGGQAGPVRGGRLVHLPTYPFQRERYWIEVAR